MSRIYIVVLLWAVLFGFESSLAASDPLIREAQTKLRDQGYDTGPIDGILGNITRAAIRRFQSDHKLPLTGELDSATRKALFAKPELKQDSLQREEEKIQYNPSYKECVSEIARETAQNYDFKAAWVADTGELAAIFMSANTRYIHRGTPEEVFKWLDGLTKETNFSQKVQGCNRYLETKTQH
jgi:hypothetical protein